MSIIQQLTTLVNNTGNLLNTVNISKQSLDSKSDELSGLVNQHETAQHPHEQYVNEEQFLSMANSIIVTQNELLELNQILRQHQESINSEHFVSIFKYMTDDQIAAYKNRDISLDITSSLRRAHEAEKYLVYPSGRGRVTGDGVLLRPGQKVIGESGIPYNQDSFTSCLINNDQDGIIFRLTGTSGGGDLPAPSIEMMRLEADNPILFNEKDGQIINNSGISSLIRPVIRLNFIFRRSVGSGTAVSLTRCFDGVVKYNVINGFHTGIFIHGSDLNSISHNRVQGCTNYSIHEQTALTFGSQNEISHNDILSYNSPNLVLIKSCSRHSRIYNNYLEATVACKGFIDIGTLECPVYGDNQVTKCYSIDVSSNRIDGHHLASSFVYRLEPWAVKTKIHDSSTVGLNMSDWSKYFVVDGQYLPLVYDSGNRACIYDLSLDSRAGAFSNFNNNDDFNPFITGLTPRNYPRACGNDLQANNAHRYIKTDGESFVIPSNITGNVSDGAYMRFLGTSDNFQNPWFEPGLMYKMSVLCRTDDPAGDDMAVGVMSGSSLIAGSSQTSTLNRYWKEYDRFFSIVEELNQKIGLRIASSVVSSGTRFIKNIKFEKAQKREIFTSRDLNVTDSGAILVCQTAQVANVPNNLPYDFTDVTFHGPVSFTGAVISSDDKRLAGADYEIATLHRLPGTNKYVILGSKI